MFGYHMLIHGLVFMIIWSDVMLKGHLELHVLVYYFLDHPVTTGYIVYKD